MDGWSEAILGDILVSKNDKSKQINSTEYQKNGTYPVIDQSIDFVCGYYDDECRVIADGLPYTVFGDHTRHTKYVDFPFVVGADGTQIIKPMKGIHDKFFYYLVANAAEKIGNYGYDRHFKHLKAYLCQFPVDGREQAQIASILTTLDWAIEQTEAIIAKQQRIKTGLMQGLLTKGIDEHGVIRSEATHEFKDSPLGRIPVEWEVVTVEDAGGVRIGRQRSPKHESGNYMKPYLRVANVFDGFIDFSDILWMNFSPAEQEKYELKPGDILLNEGQSLELVGRSAIFEGEPRTFYFQNTLIRFRCNLTTIPPYCQFVFKHWLDTREFTLVAKQTTSVAHLGGDRFAKMAFLRPTIEEQERISKRLAAHQNNLDQEKFRLNKLRRTKTGLMHDLLTGTVRVANP